MDTRAIIYLARGQQYIGEAVRSAESAKGQYPPHILFPPPLSDNWYLDCVRFLASLTLLPYEQFLLLDTDTYVCGDLSDFFKALDRFDIVGTHAIGRETMVQRNDIPASFPELHVGAMAFNHNPQVKSLFSLWLYLFEQNDNDQGALRRALWEQKSIRLGILPAEFCFRYRWGGLINGQVRVLHGREHGTPYEEIARQVNSEKGIRVWHRRELA